MRIEKYDADTFDECKRLFDRYSGLTGAEGQKLTALARKYAKTGAVQIPTSLLSISGSHNL